MNNNIYEEQPLCGHCQTMKDVGMLHLKCFGNNKYQLCVENAKCYYRQKTQYLRAAPAAEEIGRRPPLF